MYTISFPIPLYLLEWRHNIIFQFYVSAGNITLNQYRKISSGYIIKKVLKRNFLQTYPSSDNFKEGCFLSRALSLHVIEVSEAHDKNVVMHFLWVKTATKSSLFPFLVKYITKQSRIIRLCFVSKVTQSPEELRNQNGTFLPTQPY